MIYAYENFIKLLKTRSNKNNMKNSTLKAKINIFFIYFDIHWFDMIKIVVR